MLALASVIPEPWWQKPEWITGIGTVAILVLTVPLVWMGVVEFLRNRRERQLRICKAEDIDPSEIVGGFKARGCTDYLHIPRDTEIYSALLECQPIGLRGRPGIGKSHSAVYNIRQLGYSAHAGKHKALWWFQKALSALRIPGFSQLGDWYVIRPPVQVLQVANQVRVRRRRYILLLDDLNDYVRDDEGAAVLDLVSTLQSQAKQLVVVSTLRSTAPESESVLGISKIFGRWKWIDLPDWPPAQGMKLAQKCGIGIDKWDGTPLSVKQPSSEMGLKYDSLEDAAARAVLRCLVLLRNYGLESVPRTLLRSICATEVFSVDPPQFEAALTTINRFGFLKRAGQFVEAYGPYLDTIRDWSPDAHRDYPVLRDLLVEEQRIGELIAIAARWYGQQKFDQAEWICRKCVELAPRKPSCHYWLGLVLRKKGDLKGAESAFSAAVTLNPDYVRARSHLAGVWRQMGRIEEAEHCYIEILKVAPQMREAHIGFGLLLVDKLDYSAAAHQFQEAIRVAPDSAWVHCFLADALWRLNRAEEAEKSYQDAIELDRQLFEARIGFARLLLDRGDYTAAIRESQRAIHLAPGSAWAYCLLGQALSGLRELELSEHAYRKAVSLDINCPDNYVGLGIVLLDKADYPGARDVFSRVLALQPTFARAHCFLGEALLHLDQFDQAEKCYRKASELDPQMPEANSGLGVALLKKGDYIGAEEAFLKLVRSKPDNAWAYSRLGETLCLQEKPEEAEKMYLKSLALDPKRAQTRVSLGFIYLERGEYGHAEASFREATCLDSCPPEAHSGLAEALVRQQKWEELRPVEGRMLKIGSDKATAYFGPGMSALRSHDWTAAVSYLQELIALDRTHARAHQHLGEALLHANRIDEAAKALGDAVRLNPQMSKAYYLLGKALLEMGRLRDAESALRESIRIKPSFGDVHELLGETLERLGQLKEAAERYAQALELDPNLVEAKSRLESLGRSAATS